MQAQLSCGRKPSNVIIRHPFLWPEGVTDLQNSDEAIPSSKLIIGIGAVKEQTAFLNRTSAASRLE